MFTGVSGSGKSSLVFGTIAAESQRLINETYSAFVQGFMPTLARPDVDSLDGLTTAIILDQERMGANARSTVGTVTDANAFLRVIFSRMGRPHIGGPQAFSFNVPSARGAGAITVERGGRTTERRTFSIAGGMCPRCEGMGTVTDIDLTQLYDERKSLAEGAITVPGYTADGWSTRMFSESGFFDPAKPICDYTETELHDFLHKEPTKVRINGINLTYEGLVPRVQKSVLSKDVDTLQAQMRAFVERAVTFRACPDCGGTRLNEAARSSKVAGLSMADACAMQISELAGWVHGLDEPSVAPLLAALGASLDSFVEMGLGYLSLDRPAGTLSGGEAQRTRMIRNLGSSLTDVTYVFDEPTIGLHAHDVQRMNALLRRLRDKGNTVLVVEHDPEVIRIADHVVEMGPGAGPHGGTVVYEGPVEGLIASGTATGHHLDVRQELKPETRARRGSIRYPECAAPQPPGRLGGRSAGRARGGHGSRGIGQELADPWLHAPDRTIGDGHRPIRDPRLAPLESCHLYRHLRSDPHRVREGQRRQARPVQRELGRRMPGMQRPGQDLHQPRVHGRGGQRVRGVRGPALHR